MRHLAAPIKFLTCAVLLAVSDPASARSVLGLGFHGGYGESGDAESGSGRAGIHGEFRPIDNLGFIGGVDFIFEEDLILIDADGEQLGFYKAKNTPVTAMARLYLPLPKFRPFASAGVSWNFITYDNGDNIEITEDSETAFGWLLGGGAQYEASDKVGLFGEMRWEFIDADRNLDQGTQDQLKEFDYDRWNALAGVTFYF
ncbi:MAG: outer membrane beta-barrel protein [Candidatus Eisenbacteria bacterium]|nr:outer membrane beta-barrel protein [Candidatus Eisenbacteria bacterium]